MEKGPGWLRAWEPTSPEEAQTQTALWGTLGPFPPFREYTPSPVGPRLFLQSPCFLGPLPPHLIPIPFSSL